MSSKQVVRSFLNRKNLLAIINLVVVFFAQLGSSYGQVLSHEQSLDESNLVRGDSESRQILHSVAPEQQLTRLLKGLEQLKLLHSVRRIDGKILLKIENIDVEQQEMARFFVEQRLIVPSNRSLLIEIKATKP
ncbi:hypothetical protein [Propionivibrio dicarboxylicus]|uniref:Uncharacterized protein n=1 Tax=Propionivibrio dicarboxylicus TaxID=83767 RepID=A0A1G7Z0I8_9RHOO|nr:hypothetical protein [Propionivibrio dicarboxylicus]SDH02223.1 hypothetical protein SAMN05660652_01037 [Propionivibrio dicarboxylicus]